MNAQAILRAADRNLTAEQTILLIQELMCVAGVKLEAERKAAQSDDSLTPWSSDLIEAVSDITGSWIVEVAQSAADESQTHRDMIEAF